MQEKTKYQTKFKLKKGDEVIVTVGKDKGETGTIESVDLKKGRVFVGGVNVAKRHTRPGAGTEEGGIIDKTMSLAVSNVALVDPKKKTATKVGYKVEGGKKVRFAKLSGTILN